MAFYDRLRLLIEKRDLTQKGVTQELNNAPSTMGDYVQGKSKPDFETLKRLAAYFGVTTNYLLDVPATDSASEAEDD